MIEGKEIFPIELHDDCSHNNSCHTCPYCKVEFCDMCDKILKNSNQKFIIHIGENGMVTSVIPFEPSMDFKIALETIENEISILNNPDSIKDFEIRKALRKLMDEIKEKIKREQT